MEKAKRYGAGENKIAAKLRRYRPERQNLKVKLTGLFNVCHATWKIKDTQAEVKQNLVIDKSANPEKFVSSPALEYLKSIYSFCSEIFPESSFEEFFWNYIRSNFDELVPGNHISDEFTTKTFFLCIKILNHYIIIQNLSSASDDDILEHFEQKHPSLDPENIEILLRVRRSSINANSNQQGSENNHKYEDTRTKSLNESKKEYNDLLLQIEPFRNTDNNYKFKEIDSLGSFLNSNDLNQEELDFLTTGLNLTYLLNHIILNRRTDENELSSLASKHDIETIKDIIIEILPLALIVIRSNIDSARASRNAGLSDRISILNTALFNIYCSKLKEHVNRIKSLVSKDHPQRQEIKIENTPLFNIYQADWINQGTETKERQFFVLDKNADPNKLSEGVLVYLKTVCDFCSEILPTTNFNEYFWDCIQSHLSNTLPDHWYDSDLSGFVLYQAKAILREYLKSNNLEKLSKVDILVHFKLKNPSQDLFNLYLVLDTIDDTSDEKIVKPRLSPDSKLKLELKNSFENLLTNIESFRNETNTDIFAIIDSYKEVFGKATLSQERVKLIKNGLFLIYVCKKMVLQETNTYNQEIADLIGSVRREHRDDIFLNSIPLLFEFMLSDDMIEKLTQFEIQNDEESSNERTLAYYIYDFIISKFRQAQI